MVPKRAPRISAANSVLRFRRTCPDFRCKDEQYARGEEACRPLVRTTAHARTSASVGGSQAKSLSSLTPWSTSDTKDTRASRARIMRPVNLA
eukprot:scaffold100396_cov33-Tisochrysis_lutea.AAC.5